MIRPRPASPLLRPLLAAGLAAILVAGLAPAPSPVAAADDGLTAADIEGGDGEPALRPSPAYEAWVEHEDDEIEFEPGGRVTVGFSPRAGDAWPVGGKAPTKLPPGRATGAQMAAMPNGTAWAKVPGKPLPAGARDVPSGGADPSDGGTPAPDKPTLPGPVDAPSNDRTIAATGVVAEQPVADPGFDLAAASGLRRQVYGFLPYWELNGAASRLDYDVLSTIAYFSVGVTAKGNLRKRDPDGTLTTGWGGWTSAAMTKVINQAHRNRTRVVLTVSAFAWTSSQAAVQRALLGSPSARLNLVRQVVAAVRDRGADGVNLDFEPLVRGYGDEFVKLLRLFRTEFNKVRSGYSIVYDTTAYIGNYPLEASVRRGAADAIFVMGYDYRIHNASRSGSIAPLGGPGYDLADTVRAYTARVPASRIILGIPWYGRAWSTASDAPRSRTLTGLKHGYSRAVNYESVVEYVRKYGRRWDPVEQSPYVAFRRRNCTDAYGCVTSWRQIWYEDAASLKRRYALVNDYGLRGAGMWALGYEGGHAALYKALADSFLGDRVAPAAGIRVLSPDQGDEGFVVRWAGRDASPIVSYDVQVAVNGGRWKPWLAGTKATSEVYAGRHGARYAFRVRARDSRGNVGAWNVVSTGGEPRIRVGGFGTVVRDGLSYRAGPDVSALRLGRMAKGTIVAITRGPVARDGFTWYEVTQPIRQWSPASRAERGVWVAFRSASETFVRAATAPNATRVRAGLRGFTFGAPGTPAGTGTSAAQQAVRAFSPNGDGSKDGLVLRWTNASKMDAVKVRVLRPDGTLIGSRTLPDRAAGGQAWTWDGTVNRSRLKDGSYLLQLVAVRDGRTFRAPSARPATKAQRERYGIRIDTKAPSITKASATEQVISPDGDGYRDSTKLTLTASGGAVRWTATVADAKGRTIRSKAGTGATASFTWNGRTNAGRRAADGHYRVTLTLFDAAGNTARRSGTVTIDTTAPSVKPATSAAAISPNGDGLLDAATLSFRANEPVSGTARLYKGDRLVRTWKVTNAATWEQAWDGRRADGRAVSDGVYALRLKVRDAGGNDRTASTRIVLDRTLKGLAWQRHFYPQDRDTLQQSSALRFGLTRDAVTTLRIYDAGGRIVRTAWKGRSLADGVRTFTWNGKRDDGSWAPQGRYLAKLRVRGPHATIEYATWVWASAFTVTPNRTTVKAGQRLVVRFRSVEKLSTTPRVSFTQPGRSAVTVKATRLADGSFKATFTVRTGGAGAATVRVSATDAGGAVNATKIPIRVGS